jgi:poly(U)-specific endoribonuclease
MALASSRRRFLCHVTAGAALAGLGLGPAARRGIAAGAIYQRLWDADQEQRGIPALLIDGRGDPRRGYVRVNERDGDHPGHRLFVEVVIPENKRLTYDLCKRLLDNYRLDQTRREETTPEEAREILALLDAITDSAPMAAARAHLREEHGLDDSRDGFQALLFDLWFRPFDDGRNRDLSGFEHVVVGEQRQSAVNGYHFWYKYYLDDWGLLGQPDSIDFDGLRYDGPNRPPGRLTALGSQVPEVITLAFRWHAEDDGVPRPLYEPIGGFWVGCSVEGLMALGLVRFFERGRIEATINDGRYLVDLHRSPDGQSIRTFFPRFLGPA